jgi:hypothetical protein
VGRARALGAREDSGRLRVLVGMKLHLIVATFAFGVLLLALGGWLVQGLRSTPRLLVTQ